MEKFAAVFEKVNDVWIRYMEKLPGSTTRRKTRDKVKKNLQDAVQLITEAKRENFFLGIFKEH